MAFLRLRAGKYSLVFKWKGKVYTKAIGTDDENEAERIRQDAEEQLRRIRKGESAMASKLLADGLSMLDVLFGSEKTGHLLTKSIDENPLTLSQLRDAFTDHLRASDRTPGHIETTRVHFDHFIRILGDAQVMSLSDADMAEFKRRREKQKVSQGTIRADFKGLKSAVNWALQRKPPLLTTCPFTIPSVAARTVRPFLPTEEIDRLLAKTPKAEHGDLQARWVLNLTEINELVKVAADEMPPMHLPLQLLCSTGMRRIQLIRLKPTDYFQGSLTITSKKGARQKGLTEIQLTLPLKDTVAAALEKHLKALPKRSRILFPIFDRFDYSKGNQRWQGKSKRTLEQRRCDKADRLFERLVKGTQFERLDGYHALRHSFISILVSQGKTWDQIAAFVGHLDQRTTRRYIHFMPKDKRETVESIPFEF